VGLAPALEANMLVAANSPVITITFNFDMFFILSSWGHDLIVHEFIFSMRFFTLLVNKAR
jgi:hypothetical protein